MLFVQEIKIYYRKNVRYANYAEQRKAVRFWELSQKCPEENEVFFQKVYLSQNTDIRCHRDSLQSYGTEAFYGGGFNNAPFSGRIAVTKENDSYRIKYCGKRDLGFYSAKMLLNPSEYGRIVFNERGAYDYTGIWYYEITIYNFVNAPYSAYRKNLFYRKEPDYLFKDMQYLRYC